MHAEKQYFGMDITSPCRVSRSSTSFARCDGIKFVLLTSAMQLQTRAVVHSSSTKVHGGLSISSSFLTFSLDVLDGQPHTVNPPVLLRLDLRCAGSSDTDSDMRGTQHSGHHKLQQEGLHVYLCYGNTFESYKHLDLFFVPAGWH